VSGLSHSFDPFGLSGLYAVECRLDQMTKETALAPRMRIIDVLVCPYRFSAAC